MSADKYPQNKRFDSQTWTIQTVTAGSNTPDESEWGSRYRVELSTIITRAVVVYGVLFFGLGLVMSLLDVNPLANNGLMPKGLLAFVGLSLLIALANRLASYAHESGHSWLTIARGLARTALDKHLHRGKTIGN